MSSSSENRLFLLLFLSLLLAGTGLAAAQSSALTEAGTDLAAARVPRKYFRPPRRDLSRP